MTIVLVVMLLRSDCRRRKRWLLGLVFNKFAPLSPTTETMLMELTGEVQLFK